MQNSADHGTDRVSTVIIFKEHEMLKTSKRFALSRVNLWGLILLGAFALAVMGCDNPVQTWDEAAEARAVTVGTATINPVTISGTINTPIPSTLVTITLVNNTFDSNITGTDASLWFANLPQGLSASVTSLRSRNQVAEITVSGTPQAVSSFYIRGTIPGSALIIDSDPIDITPVSTVVYDIRWPFAQWTQSGKAPFADGSVNASAYGNKTFVVGNRNNGTAAYSLDGGATWDQINVWSGSNHISYLTFINGLFYAAGDGGSLASSPDGITWTLISASGLLNGEDIRTIAYGNRITIIAGTSGQAAYTNGYPTSGSTWTALTIVPSFTANYNSIVYGGGLFVATGQNALSAYSLDGIKWTDTTAQTQVIFPNAGGQSSIKMAAYDPTANKFVIVGFHEAAYMVPNGITFTWTGVDLTDIMGTTSRTSWLNCVTFGGGYFVAGGSEGQSISSTDGINWAITNAQGQFPAPSTDIPFVNSIPYGEDRNVYLIGGGMDDGPGIAAYNY
ncbi:hypothetical protein Holit_02366 [Hollandina sp. SP2]